MRRIATPFLLLLLCAGAPAVASAQSLLFDYVGFDYEDPDPNTAVFGEPASGYVSLGLVPNLFAPLVANTTDNEYTYVISGLTPVNLQMIGPYAIIDYSPGTLRVYEDSKSSGTAADYGSNPPNGLAPPSFIDGALFLDGILTSFQFVLNTGTGTGSFEAKFEVTGGSQFPNFPSNQLKGWTFAGATGNATNIPPGYAHQIDGQTFLDKPVLVRNVSWGRFKNAYR